VVSAYIYPIALAIISAFTAALEYFFPKRQEQKQLRERLASDFVHLVINGHFLGIILFGVATHYILPHVDKWLASAGLTDAVYRNAAADWPVWLQIIVALLVVDFVQWAVHNLLHRVPFLWEFHKTHHSIVDGEMDWIVAMRFQWTEVVIYKSILYLPLAFFGFGEAAILTHAIFGTLIGHLNHANLDWEWGPFKYVLNSPNMHIWHHDYEGDTHTTVNFGIIFSMWDWIFGTAKMPGQPPAKLGFPGVEAFPTNFFTQSIWPLQNLIPPLSRNTAIATAAGVALVSIGWIVHEPGSRKAPTPMFGEPAASSQPLVQTPPDEDAYAASDAERDAALAKFGEQARKDGFAKPAWMVSVPELARALGHKKLVLLDVRPMERFEEGHIPTARQLYRPDYSGGDIPGLSLDIEALEAMLRKRGVNEDSIVIAYTDGGPEHYRLWWTLRQVAGFDIRVLDGGLQQWKAIGHGLATGKGLAAKPGEITLSRPEKTHRPHWNAIDAFVKANQGAVIVDTRSEAEYTGQKHHKKAKRAGHIPGAKHIEWWSIVRDTKGDHRLQKPAELDALFAAKLSISRETPIVTYCQSGTRSSGTYFALAQLGHDLDKIVNYDGSWAEYSRQETLPIQF